MLFQSSKPFLRSFSFLMMMITATTTFTVDAMPFNTATTTSASAITNYGDSYHSDVKDTGAGAGAAGTEAGTGAGAGNLDSTTNKVIEMYDSLRPIFEENEPEFESKILSSFYGEISPIDAEQVNTLLSDEQFLNHLYDTLVKVRSYINDNIDYGGGESDDGDANGGSGAGANGKVGDGGNGGGGGGNVGEEYRGEHREQES